MADEKKKGKQNWSEFVEVAIDGIDNRLFTIPKEAVSNPRQWEQLKKVATRVVETPESAAQSTPEDARVVGPAERKAIESGAGPRTLREAKAKDETRIGGPFVEDVKQAVGALLSGPNAVDAAKAIAEATKGAASGVKEYFKDVRSVPAEEQKRLAEENTPQVVKDINARRDKTAAEAANTLKLLATPYAARVADVGGMVTSLGELDKSQMLQDIGKGIQEAAIGAVTPGPVPEAPPNLPTALEAGGMPAATSAPIPPPTEAEVAAGMSLPRDAAGNVIPPPADASVMPPITTMPDMPVGTPPGTTPGTTPGGSVSASVKTKTSKPGAAPEMQPPTVPAFDELRQARDAAIFAENAKAEAESLGYQKKVELLDKQMADAAAFEQKQTEIQLARENRMKQAQDGLMRLQSRFAELEKASPDPNRFWNNKSDGQKAMAVVAGALFGFTGQGMQWLQRLDSLVQQDVENQFADLKRQEAAVGRQVDIQNNLVSLARQQGLDDMEALNAARIMMKEKYAMQLESVAATTGSDITKAEALKKASDIRASYIKEKTALELETKRAADQAALTRAQIRKMDAETRETYASMGLKQAQAQAGGGKVQEVKSPAAMELGALRAAATVANDLRVKFGKENVVSRFLDKPAAMFPNTDASNYNIARDQAINMIAPMMGAGVLQKHDLERWENLMAKAGDMAGEEKLKILVKDIQTLYNEKRAALEATGYDVSGLPPLTMPVDFTPSR